MPVTLARSMDAVAICTCSLPTAGLPRHLPLTLSLLPRTASPATGRRQRPGPRQPPPGAPAPRPPAEVQPVCLVRGRGGPAGWFPPRPAGIRRGGESLNPARGNPRGGGVPSPENRTLPVWVGVCSGVWREHPAQKAPREPGVFALGGYKMWQCFLAGGPTVQVLHMYSSKQIRNKNK